MLYNSSLKAVPIAAEDRPAETGVVTVATTADEVEKLRPVWRSFQIREVDSDIDYFLTVIRNADNVVEPHVVHIRRLGGRDLLAVARLEDVPIPFRVGYSVAGRVTLRAIVVAFGGMLGAECRADEDLVTSQLLKSLDKGDADLVLMRNVEVGSTLHAAFAASTPMLRQAQAQPVARRWIADIPDTLDEFLEVRSAKTRSTLRRQERQLLKEFDGRLRLRRFERPQEASELFRDLEAVASLTYQRGLGVGFTGSSMDKGLIELGLAKGWHRTWMLYLDQRPVAFWTGMAYGKTFFIGTPGFDPEHVKDSVGRFTMFRMIEDLCSDPAISFLDYGRGEAEYKSAFGRCARLECDVLLASRRPRAMFVLMAYSLASVLNNQAKQFIEDTAWGRRLKAALRRRHADRRE